MTEHVHEWEWDEDISGIPFFYCLHCIDTVFPDEIKARVNAVERLSAETADNCANSVMCHQHDRCAYDHEIAEVQTEIDALRSYASILEGKDE